MSSATWFERLFGFKESLSSVKKYFRLSHDHSLLLSTVNNRVFPIGTFSTPSLKALRNQALELRKEFADVRGNLKIEHVAIQGALELHHQYPGATFQSC